MLKPSIVLPLFCCILLSCATSPLGRSQLVLLPAAQINTMGVEAFTNMKTEMQVDSSPQINRYVSCVSNAVLAVSESDIQTWEVVVFKEDSANAFALPGGKIGVHTGLLPVADNQHRLATVIGHEIGHVIANHGNERVSQQFAVQQGIQLIQAAAQVETQMGQTLMGLLGVGAQFGILMPYGRVQESEADLIGLDLMAMAGFDPRESTALWENMSKAGGGGPPEFLSTHPSHDTRIQSLSQNMGRAMQLYQQAQAAGRRPNCRVS